MCGREHVLVGDDGTSAKELPPGVPQRHHPRVFVIFDFAAADDPWFWMYGTAGCARKQNVKCYLLGRLKLLYW